MPDTKTYPAGVPCWIDTEQPDVDAACDFYGQLFGWTFTEAMPPGSSESYRIASLDGRDVAAVGSTPVPGAAVWNTYIAVDDAEQTADLVASEGGAVVTPPQDAGPGGRLAVCVDPTGGTFRLWQARQRPGAQLVNEPGTWNFSDLHTTEPAAAEAFYHRIFGWEADRSEDVDGQLTVLWRRPGYGAHLAQDDPDLHRRLQAVSAPPGFEDAVAWLAPVSATGHEPPHWHVSFAVADRDESLARARQLGATLDTDPVDTPWTRQAVITDPQGATFTLSQFTPPGS